jgi:hypothetical protein
MAFAGEGIASGTLAQDDALAGFGLSALVAFAFDARKAKGHCHPSAVDCVDRGSKVAHVVDDSTVRGARINLAFNARHEVMESVQGVERDDSLLDVLSADSQGPVGVTAAESDLWIQSTLDQLIQM